MPNEVVVALIAAVPGSLAAVAAWRSARHAKRARQQVENDHETNLREEQDVRFTATSESLDTHSGKLDEVMHAVKELGSSLKETRSDIRGMRTDIGRLADNDNRLADRVLDLEKRKTK